MAKTTKKTVAKKDETKFDAKTMARKGALAYLGLYGVAFERAKLRTEQVRGFYNTKTDGLFGDLVARGTKLEEQGVELAKTAQKRATVTFETTTDKVKNALPTALPFGANDRVEELEAEVTALNKKVAALSKKAKVSAKAGINKEVVMTTEKTAKKAA